MLNRPLNIFHLIIGALTLTLAACSAKVEGGDPGGPGGPGPFKPNNRVAGPELSGEWLTKCLKHYGGQSRTVYLKIEPSQHILRTEQLFSDENCLTLNKEKSWQGTFTFSEKRSAEIFTVEYRINRGSGVTQITYENIRRLGTTLFVSDYAAGDSIPLIELTLKTSTPSPGPTPTPTPTPLPIPPPTPTPIPDTPAAPTRDYSPSYGDSVSYKGTNSGATYTSRYTCQGTTDGTTWTVYKEINGMPRGYSYFSKLASSVDYHAKMRSCQSANERVETLVTELGAFITCRKEDAKSIVWYGNIPIFGIVRQQDKDGTFEVTLNRFTYRQ